MIEWYKRYIEPGEEFIPCSLTVRIDLSGMLVAVAPYEPSHADHHFGSQYVGQHIEKYASGRECHSPVYLDAGTNRFYYIRSRQKETRENKDGQETSADSTEGTVQKS